MSELKKKKEWGCTFFFLYGPTKYLLALKWPLTGLTYKKILVPYGFIIRLYFKIFRVVIMVH